MDGQKFVWTKAIEVGVVEMDDEHRELIRLMNEVLALNSDEAEKSKILEAVGALCDYSRKHFADEEQLMESLGFADLGPHRRAHGELLQRMTAEASQFERSSLRLLPMSFFSFLQFWLKTHIQGSDRKYGAVAAKRTGL